MFFFTIIQRTPWTFFFYINGIKCNKVKCLGFRNTLRATSVLNRSNYSIATQVSKFRLNWREGPYAVIM